MKHRNLIISALALILMSACTEDAGTGLAPDDLAGEWTAISFVLTSKTDATMSMDLVKQDGAVVTLVLREDGTYSFSFVSDVEPAEDEAGTYTVAGNILTFFPDPEYLEPNDDDSETVGILRVGDTLTLTMDDRIEPLDGDPIDAVLVIILTR